MNTTTRAVGTALACLLSASALAPTVSPAAAQTSKVGTPKATISQPASPGARSAADATAAWFATTDPAERERLRATLSAGDDDTARFGLGAVQFFSGLERFAQALNRHGAQAPRGLRMLGLAVAQPGAVPADQPAEPITYALFRSHLEQLHAAMEAAAATLAQVDRGAATAIPIDLGEARLRLSEDGSRTILSLARQMRMLQPPRRRGGTRASEPIDALPFRFDTADAVWLQGYANVVMAQLDFALAHDFERMFDQTFHVFFPRAGLPVGEALAARDGQPARGGFDTPVILDAIAMVHLMDFAVVEPQRRARTRERLLEVVRLSRENWRLIESETDAENEWLPGPQQGAAHPLPGVAVTRAQVAAWRRSLDLFEAVLEGRMLIPDPRRNMMGAVQGGTGRGVNLRRFFASSERFDLVLFITGHGTAPFMETGPVAGGTEWRAAQGAFGERGLLGTAIWFN